MAEEEPRYFMPFQYANEANVRAHYEGTGAEIVEELDRVDVLVAGLGTGGTLMGAGARVREAFPDVVVAAAEPLPGDPVIGLRSLEDGYVPPILDVSQLDRKLLVTNAESVAGVRALLEREAIFAGVSSGAVVHVGRKLADGARARASSSACSPTAAGSTCPRRSGPRRTWSRRWRIPSGGDPDRGPTGAGAARARRGAERGVRPARVPRRRRRALPARRERAREPVPLPAEARRPGGLLPGGRGLPGRRLPLASDGQRRGRRARTSRTSGCGTGGRTSSSPCRPASCAAGGSRAGEAAELELAE